MDVQDVLWRIFFLNPRHWMIPTSVSWWNFMTRYGRTCDRVYTYKYYCRRNADLWITRAPNVTIIYSCIYTRYTSIMSLLHNNTQLLYVFLSPLLTSLIISLETSTSTGWNRKHNTVRVKKNCKIKCVHYVTATVRSSKRRATVKHVSA